jgi:hypothetical protein
MNLEIYKTKYFELSEMGKKMNIDEIVKNMISYGRSIKGIGRGNENGFELKTYRRKDVGPFWSYGTHMPSMNRVKKEGVICIGLISLCLRHVGLIAPFLFNKNYKDLIFGFGGSDEWLYTFRNKVEPFNPHGVYPSGTLLFRVFNLYDHGHIAILIDASGPKKPLMKCRVLQSAGQPLGTGLVSDSDMVEKQHTYYSKGTHWKWDKTGKFSINIDHGYYMYIIRPEIYLPECKHVS